jgi:spore germination cell wall hydrolase CwlJ-like protein
MDGLLALLLLGASPFPIGNQELTITQPAQIQKPIDTVEKNCLAANIYYEARGEAAQGQKAVAAVTLNRVKSKKYPKTICGVVTQRAQFSWVHQQPKHIVDKALNGVAPSQKPIELLAYQKAHDVASEVIRTKQQMLPEQVLWYHTTKVNPVWNKQMQKVSQIGTHVFYKHKTQGKYD